MQKTVTTVTEHDNGQIINIELPSGENIRIVVVTEGIEVTTHYDNGYTAVLPRSTNQVVIKNML